MCDCLESYSIHYIDTLKNTFLFVMKPHYYSEIYMKTLAVIKNAFVGGKLNKVQLTLLLCCNDKGQFEPH